MEKEINYNRTKNVLRNICVSTVILFICIIMIFKSYRVEEGSQRLLYTYNVSQNVNYSVKLKENDFFTSQELEMNKTYISSLVDKINMDFSYSLSGNKDSKTTYTYQIVAITDVKYSSVDQESKPSIWSKQYVLVEPKKIETESSRFVINENLDVDYATYNSEVKKFKEQLRVPAIAELQVKLIIRSESDVPNLNDKVMETSIMSLKMDLAQDIFAVENQFKNADTKSIYETIEGSKSINKAILVLGCIFVIVAIMILLDSIKKSIKFNKKTDYAIALNRILKNYGDIVAEIVNPVDIDSLNVIEVKNFDQLLDIEEEIRMPILFYETIPDEQGEFIIVYDNMAYRYVIG